MKSAIDEGNYIGEKYPSLFDNQKFFMNIICFIAITLFLSGCCYLINQLQLRILALLYLETHQGCIPPARPVLGMVLVAFSVIMAVFVHRPLYLWAYRETDDESRPNDTVKHDTLSDAALANQTKWQMIPLRLRDWMQAEYLLNAIVSPKAVYSRIKETLNPSARTLHVATRMDIIPASRVLMRHIWPSFESDKRVIGDTFSVIVPVVFQLRGELANHLKVKDSHEELLPTMRTRDVAELIVQVLDVAFATYGGSGVRDEWQHCKSDYKNALTNTAVAMDEGIVRIVRDLLYRTPFPDDLRKIFDETVVILSTCYVLCVHIQMDWDTKEPYIVWTDMRLPLVAKTLDSKRLQTADGYPRADGFVSRLIRCVNSALNGFRKSSGVFFYNLANANLTKSYHLMMLGPEDTFCARADILRVPRPDWSLAVEDRHFKCERLRGQRHAHLLFTGPENYHGAALMFYYIGRPQDLFFAAGLLALVCLVSLVIGMTDSMMGEDLLGTDVPAVLLLVLSAVCPWLYDEARNDRTESFILDVSAFLTTSASVLALALFTDSGLGLQLVPSGIAANIWRLLLVLVATDVAALMFLSSLHASLYKAFRLDRTSRHYGVLKCWNKAIDFARENWSGATVGSLRWRLRCLMGLDEPELIGVRRNESDRGPFVASSGWPKGWLAVPGSYWWEIERERYRNPPTS